jgi:hypothetical protein
LSSAADLLDRQGAGGAGRQGRASAVEGTVAGLLMLVQDPWQPSLAGSAVGRGSAGARAEAAGRHGQRICRCFFSPLLPVLAQRQPWRHFLGKGL